MLHCDQQQSSVHRAHDADPTAVYVHNRCVWRPQQQSTAVPHSPGSLFNVPASHYAAFLLVNLHRVQNVDQECPRSTGLCMATAAYLPQFDGFIIGCYEVLGVVAAANPSDFVDLLFDFQAFEIVELRLVRLELCEVPVLKPWAPWHRGRLPLIHTHIPLRTAKHSHEACASFSREAAVWHGRHCLFGD